MHISNAQINKVYELHLHKVHSQNTGLEAVLSGKTDEFVLSSRAADMQKIKDAVAKLPDTRVETVQSLKQSIESGSYQLDAAGFADKMLKAISVFFAA